MIFLSFLTPCHRKVPSSVQHFTAFPLVSQRDNCLTETYAAVKMRARYSYMQRHFASAFLRAFFGLLLLSSWGVSVLGEERPQHPASPAMSFAAVNHGAGNALYLGTTSATVELSLRCEQNSKRPRPKIYSTFLATPNAGAPPHSAREQTLPRTRPDAFASPRKLCPSSNDDDPFLS